ncbi:hypothetical protein OC861_005474, partial [Tilletia horrida]
RNIITAPVIHIRAATSASRVAETSKPGLPASSAQASSATLASQLALNPAPSAAATLSLPALRTEPAATIASTFSSVTRAASMMANADWADASTACASRSPSVDPAI